MTNDVTEVVVDSDMGVTPKRPLAVWLITIFYGLSFIGYLAAILVVSKLEMHPAPEIRQYYASLSVLGLLWVALPQVLVLASVVSLFLLKRIALKLWLGVISLGVADYIYRMSSNDVVSKYVEQSAPSIFLSFLITIVVYFYTRSLDAKGVLK